MNCRWFWREINQPINESSQMPPAPTPIQATVRSPNRRAIQKAVRCHAAEQFNLIRATDLILIAISLRRCENFNSELQTKKRDYNRRCTDDLLEAIDEMLVLHQLRQKRSNQDPFPTYELLFNLTEPCKTRSQSHKLNELIFSQVQLGCSLLDVGTKATPSAHLAIRSLPFGLPQMTIKLVGIALAKLNSK